MSLLSLSLFTAFLVNLWMIFFVVSKNFKVLSKLVCILLISSIAIWNLAFTFIQGSVSHDIAIIWLNISSFGWCSIAVFALWLSLVLSNNDKILWKWYFYLIFLIPVFFIYKQWTGYLVSDLLRQSYGWSIMWSKSVWPWFFYAYYCSIPITVLYIGYTTLKKRRYSFEKRRIILTISSGMIFFLSASLMDIVLPRLNIYSIPPSGSILALILVSAIIYGITKYRFMTITPAYAASDILATMSDSLVLISPEGKIIEVNNAALTLLGYTSEELTGSPASILFPEGAWQFLEGKESAMLKEKSFDRHQIFFRTKKGEDIPVSLSVSTMKDKEGDLIGVVGVARDMREILLLQKKEKELAAEKARTEVFQERALELQEAYDKLSTTQTQLIQSEKMAAVGQLAGGVAHEINNPMGVILGFAQSIVKGIKAGDLLYMPLKSIEREALRCRKLVGDLLTFSRVDKTKAEEIDINHTIEDTLSFVEGLAKVKSISIIKEYGTGIPRIIANKNQIQQVIVNLCNNAIDAMPEGGNIKLSTKDTGDRILIEVSDTGKGMTEEVKKHLFEPFFTTKEAGKGTGLGLSFCFEIIQNHNGTIEASSEPDKGAVFVIKLPKSGLI